MKYKNINLHPLGGELGRIFVHLDKIIFIYSLSAKVKFTLNGSKYQVTTSW